MIRLDSTATSKIGAIKAMVIRLTKRKSSVRGSAYCPRVHCLILLTFVLAADS